MFYKEMQGQKRGLRGGGGGQQEKVTCMPSDTGCIIHDDEAEAEGDRKQGALETKFQSEGSGDCLQGFWHAPDQSTSLPHFVCDLALPKDMRQPLDQKATSKLLTALHNHQHTICKATAVCFCIHVSRHFEECSQRCGLKRVQNMRSSF